MATPTQINSILCYLNGILILLVIGGLALKSSQSTAKEPVDSSVLHGNILTPLLKALSEQEPWGDVTPRTRPESRYVRYMKKLYKMSSKHERSHEANHLYNTVRLITPRDERLIVQSKDLFMQDLFYNLDRVRAKEQLLKSVLLYSFDQDQATSFSSICYLDVKEQEHAEQQLYSSIHYSVRFRVHNERSRRKWVEVEVTSFLQPLIKSHKKDIHLLINLTCIEDGGTKTGSQEYGSPVELTLRSPSLLLYLNDTSELAYQRWPASAARSGSSSPMLGMVERFESQTEFKSGRRISRSRRNPLKSKTPKPSPKASVSDLIPKYDFPEDECHLYDFRVSFSQLKLDHWIIAPHKYNPRYCKGTCPRVMGYIYGSPVHTMVQNIIYEKLDSSVPRPSCVPSDYNPLSVLTIENDHSIAYKEYEEMIATKCTCR